MHCHQGIYGFLAGKMSRKTSIDNSLTVSRLTLIVADLHDMTAILVTTARRRGRRRERNGKKRTGKET